MLPLRAQLASSSRPVTTYSATVQRGEEEGRATGAEGGEGKQLATSQPRRENSAEGRRGLMAHEVRGGGIPSDESVCLTGKFVVAMERDCCSSGRRAGRLHNAHAPPPGDPNQRTVLGTSRAKRKQSEPEGSTDCGNLTSWRVRASRSSAVPSVSP